MGNPFVRKLGYGARLTDADREILEAVCTRTRLVRAHTDLIQEGDNPRNVHLLLEGFVCRYKVLHDGKRQIVAFFVPGDICDLHVHILGEMDHSIGTLVDSLMVEIDPSTVEALTSNPRINRALWWGTLVDEGTLREWLVNMGQRPADQQMGHIFCELLLRLQAVGRAEGDRFTLPLTQQELADTMGVTVVHVNRVLKHLRREGLVELNGREIRIPDVRRLRTFSDFEPNYLHLRETDRDKGPAVREKVPV
ncbi:MAG: Crp/Fnr family transcriptional regulator [Rhizobiales bacterium]|nr:Crp/Fnr family transcriptional regulator [Hyphomicrobiales bacterium]